MLAVLRSDGLTGMAGGRPELLEVAAHTAPTLGAGLVMRLHRGWRWNGGGNATTSPQRCWRGTCRQGKGSRGRDGLWINTSAVCLGGPLSRSRTSSATGGMAVVYRARDTILGRDVALKVLKKEFAEDPDIRKRFSIESRAVAKLSHHNIVSVFDVGSEDGTDYIVMELIEGITLKQYLQRKGHLSWEETIFFAEQVARALMHAHSRGIIHQDVKPQNVIILRDGTAKLTDFGIASFAAAQETRVVQEAIGSVHYISPEQAKGSKIDYRTDLYSLGVMMYGKR